MSMKLGKYYENQTLGYGYGEVPKVLVESCSSADSMLSFELVGISAVNVSYSASLLGDPTRRASALLVGDEAHGKQSSTNIDI